MFETLTHTQREIVLNKRGKFVVRACPGSGKTYCVSARISRLINNWTSDYSGVATLSFTNVAWREIEKKYDEIFQMGDHVRYPHFLGTIDSFINRYIFLPHGHLVLGCPARPTLVGAPHGIWTGKNYYQTLFDNITYNLDGTFCAISDRRMPQNWKNIPDLLKVKTDFLKAGYATQSDANYFAMKILEGFPAIAKAIVQRFPVLIVDEAQDTSDIQMRIIDLLVENGLNEVMLVGDPDQAIFEWNDARPDLLVKKYSEWPDSILLNENRRSSQHICNTTHGISSLEVASTAINDNVKDFPHVPRIITYNNNLPAVRDAFLKECEDHGITVSKDNIAIVYRAKDLINEITGIAKLPFNNPTWFAEGNYTKDFARGKFLFDKGEFKEGFKSFERAIVKSITGSKYASEEDVQDFINKFGYLKFKQSVYSVITEFPKTDVSLGKWVNAANLVLAKAKAKFSLSIPATSNNFTFDQLFIFDDTAIDRPYRIGTVHSVKGETFDATLLILKTKGLGKAYKTLLNEGASVSASEELRIAYVGMTRPRKVLVIAVPDDKNYDAWQKRILKN